jgi:hypothetical protein
VTKRPQLLYELVRAHSGGEELIYTHADKGKVIRMRNHWKEMKPRAKFRIDKLTRSQEEAEI